MFNFARRVFLPLLLALFCAPLVAHIYLGSYSRFIADDFCSAAVARARGVFGGSVHWYMTWTGRFSANFLDALFGYLGPAATPFATGLVLTIWFVVLAVTLVQILPRNEVRTLFSCIIAAMILFATLNVIPLIGQSLYWGQGMRSVVPPLILGTAYVGLLLNRSDAGKSHRAWFIVAAALTFIAAGFAETFFAVQTGAIVFALVIAFVTKKRTYLLLLVAGFVGSLAGGFIVFIAPGNRFRQNAFPPPPAIPELLAIALRGLWQFFELILDSPAQVLTLAGLAVCGFILGLGIFRTEERDEDHHVSTLIWLPIVAFVLLLACWVPMAYGTSLLLAFRTFIIPAYVLVCSLLCWAYFAGRIVRHRLAHYKIVATLSFVVLVAFGLIAASSSIEIFRQRSTFADYARRWEEREQMIRQAKSQGLPVAIVLRQHNWAALDEIAVDPKITWLTKCVNDYYGIAVMPDLGDLYGEPNATAKQAALVQQFGTIKTVPDAIPTELNNIYKSDRGKIGFYKSNLSADLIKSHYDAELSRLGWKFIGTKKVEAFQVFSGGTQNLYCNGEVAATLFITGQDEARLGYTYSLALNWGMSSGYVWTAIDCQQ